MKLTYIGKIIESLIHMYVESLIYVIKYPGVLLDVFNRGMPEAKIWRVFLGPRPEGHAGGQERARKTLLGPQGSDDNNAYACGETNLGQRIASHAIFGPGRLGPLHETLFNTGGQTRS
jgi:hypothetical protein